MDFRFFRAPFLSDLALLAVLAAPEVFFVEILVMEDFAALGLGVELIFALHGPAVLPVGEGLFLTVVLTEIDDFKGADVAPLSVTVLVPIFVGVPTSSNFSDLVFSVVTVVGVIAPPAAKKALGEEVAVTPSVVVALIEVELAVGLVMLAPSF